MSTTYPNELQISVTEELILAGGINCRNSCPIALGIRTALKKNKLKCDDISVGARSGQFYTTGLHFVFDFNDDIQKWIMDFDQNLEVKPLTFDLKIRRGVYDRITYRIM